MKYQRIDSKLFTENRKRFIKHLKPNSLAVFNSNDLMPTNADGTMPFRQNNDLFYLSGVDQEESILLIFPDSSDKKHREILFLKETNEEIAIWEGAKLTKDDAYNVSGIKTVYWLTEFETVFKALMGECEGVYLNTNEHLRAKIEVESRDSRFFKWCKEQYPLHEYERAAPIMHRLRAIKSDMEIQLIKKVVFVGLFGVLLGSMGMRGALGLTASLSLEVGSSNVVEYDVHTGSPASWNGDLMVTADGNMGVISSHQEHDEQGISGTLFSVVTAVDVTNDWSENSSYSGDLGPKSVTATTAVTTAGATGSPSGRYATVVITIDAAAAAAAYHADQRVHHINVVDAVVQDTSFSLGTISGTVGLTVKLVSSSREVFSYQGELSDGGVTVDGDYDLRFRLYDESSGGSQQGATVLKEDVAVAAGRFTTKLDFGSGVFDGQERWLEIDVRNGVLTDPNLFVTLTPRQELTAGPHAIFALDSKVHKANVTVEGGHIGLGTAVDTDYGITNDSSSAPLYGARFHGSSYGIEGRDSSAGVTTYGRLGNDNYGGYFYNQKPTGVVYGSRSEAETLGNSTTYGGYHFGRSISASSAAIYGAFNYSRGDHSSYTGDSYGSFNYSQATGTSGNIYGAYNNTHAGSLNNSKTVYGTYSRAGGTSTSSGDHYGVYGVALGANAQTYGMYGQGGLYGIYGSGSEYGVMGVDRDNVDTYGRLGHGNYGGYFYNKKASGST
ncbi:MAG: aminopeptidase P N-terminal domain-containing protein, partial [Planctomycetes bacterium]|nr:aminopeptidase P N-terminal domain-containing protein [Planctomycetota bacterium]